MDLELIFILITLFYLVYNKQIIGPCLEHCYKITNLFLIGFIFYIGFYLGIRYKK
jgi:hypothetical protein